MQLCVYICILYIHLCISEINDNNYTKERREEFQLFCYYKVLALSEKVFMLLKSGLGSCYLKVNVDWLQVYTASCRARTTKTKKKKSVIYMLRKEIK